MAKGPGREEIKIKLQSAKGWKAKSMFEHITASEIAGYGVGALLLSATISATKLDAFISSSQRSSLGMCRRCGDLKLVSCSNCKGFGLIKEGGPFNLVPITDENKGLGSKPKAAPSRSCANCGGKGHFPCSECSKLS